MLKLHQLPKIKKKRRRIARGIAAGKGKTAGRGTKGQKSRSGRKMPVGFEGGQTPLKRRLPKLRGFRSPRQREVTKISLEEISQKFKNGEKVTHKSLKEKNLIAKKTDRVKIIEGKLQKKLEFLFLPISKEAKRIVEKAGGKVVIKEKIKSLPRAKSKGKKAKVEIKKQKDKKPNKKTKS